MRKPRIFVTAKISLQDATVPCSIKYCAPGFEFAHAIGCFPRVQLSHAPVVDVLTTTHRIGEMHFPIVALIDIGEGCGNAPFRHHCVGFAEQTFTNHADGNSSDRCFNRCAQTGAAAANN